MQTTVLGWICTINVLTIACRLVVIAWISSSWHSRHSLEKIYVFRNLKHAVPNILQAESDYFLARQLVVKGCGTSKSNCLGERPSVQGASCPIKGPYFPDRVVFVLRVAS